MTYYIIIDHGQGSYAEFSSSGDNPDDALNNFFEYWDKVNRPRPVIFSCKKQKTII